ncbi:MAG: Uma2 family endonuclease [Chloroflexaceae bacterium]|nr:Uma2 family endonuclease [Chloroflexaceae bacterium]NJL34186.1 Uma2 family endonuclease [Chloroflexaceae bacterium]
MAQEPATADIAPDLSQIETDTEDAGPLLTIPPECWPNVDHLVTEDDTPVDSIFAEKQQRLLVDSLYASWTGPGAGRSFVAMSNVGLFYSVNESALVPDVLVSLDVSLPENPHIKAHRSYFVWLYGKPPELVIEDVSNKIGRELDYKLQMYARIGISYYAVFDSDHYIQEKTLQLYERHPAGYVPVDTLWMEALNLGLTVWEGDYEGMQTEWLRWCDRDGNLLLTGGERARRAEQQAKEERTRAEAAEQTAEQQRLRAERLAARLREMGIEEA